MYTMSEAAKKIGVSRQSVYSKIDKENLGQYVKDSEKGKVITDKGFSILKGLFSEYIDSKPKIVNSQKDSKSMDNLENEVDSNSNEPVLDKENKNADTLQDTLTVDYINSLKSEIESLKSIISDQSQQTVSLTRLLENSQVLQKQQQDKIFLLESPQDSKKSIWSIFKRN